MIDEDDLLRKLKPTLKGRAKDLWYLGLFAQNNEEQRSYLSHLRLMADLYSKIDFGDEIRLPPPTPKKLQGELNIGSVLYPDSSMCECGIERTELLRHIIISGMTGSGKTNLVKHLLIQLANRNIPFLVFDWKGSYRRLLKGTSSKQVQVYKLGRDDCPLRFNPLIPPNGIEPKNWAALLVDILRHAFFLGQGVEYLLRKGINSLYKRNDQSTEPIPFTTFSELESLLLKEYARGREMLWHSSAKRALAHLGKSGLLHYVLNSPSKQSLPDLLDKPTVIELDELGIGERLFVTEALLLWIYIYRKSQGRTKQLRHVLVVEEGHQVLSARKEREFGGETVIENMVRMVREFGEGIIVVDQEPHKLARSVIANSGCKISFRLGNGWDADCVAQAIGLEKRNRNWLLRIPTGQAIVSLKERFSENVLTQIPLTETEKEEKSPYRYP